MARVLLLLGLALPLALSFTVTSHLTNTDRVRLTSLFSPYLTASSDLPSLHHAVLGSLLLSETIPSPGVLCTSLASHQTETSVETLYQAASTAAALGCPITLSTEAAAAVAAGLESSSTASIFFAAKAQEAVGGKLNSDALLKALTKALKKDDSLLSLGLAFHTAALATGDLGKFFDRIEDAVVQADEVDGSMLQFEGGLSVTSVVLTGAARLAVAAKKKLPVTGEQAVKFANYLMSRKSVQQAKGAFHLLDAVSTLSNNPQYVPLSITLASSLSDPIIVLSCSTLLGSSPGPFTLTLDTATRLSDDAVVAANTKLVALKTTDKHSLDLAAVASAPPPGFYELVVTATPAKADPRFVGTQGVSVTVKVLATVQLADIELRVTDTENGGRGAVTELAFPATKAGAMTVSSKEHLTLSFNVVNIATKNAMAVHQAFIKLTHVDTKTEIIYIAETGGSDNNYKFDLDLATAATDLGSKNGEYLITVVVGDAVIANPISWDAVKIDVTFPEGDENEITSSDYEVKSEIRHTFRQPEARPPMVVSNVFTLICLSPFLLMLMLWAKMGVNISNITFSLSTLGFYFGLASIFGLYVVSWLCLNMFQTMQYLLVLGVFTFLCGNSLLSSIARKKTKSL